MTKSKIVLLLLFIICIVLFNYYELSRFLNVATFKLYQSTLETLYGTYPLPFILLFILIYTVLVAVSFPGVLILTLVSGALFGPAIASLVIITGGSIGATIAMLSSRYIFRVLY